jgi:hypothetical protein
MVVTDRNRASELSRIRAVSAGEPNVSRECYQE